MYSTKKFVPGDIVRNCSVTACYCVTQDFLTVLTTNELYRQAKAFEPQVNYTPQVNTLCPKDGL